MDQQMTKKLVRKIVAGFAVLILLVVGLVIYNTQVFRLVGIDPAMNKFPSAALFIKISFNKPLLANKLTITGSNNSVDSYSVSGSVITVLLNSPLEPRKYQLNVMGISDTRGQRLADQVFVFTPQNLPESSLSTTQKSALDEAQSDYHALMNDPVIRLLPFYAGGNEFMVTYTVQYVHQKPIPTVVITAPTQVGQDDGLAWLKLVGADPAKYQIQYITGPVQ